MMIYAHTGAALHHSGYNLLLPQHILRNHVNRPGLKKCYMLGKKCCFIALKNNNCNTTNTNKANSFFLLFVFLVSYARLKVPERFVECHHSGDGDQRQRAQASAEWPTESRRDSGRRSTSRRWTRCNGENGHQVCLCQPHSLSRRSKRAKKQKWKLQCTKHLLI